MKKLLIATAFAALAAGSASAETVRIATEGAYEPYNFINEKGELDGFEIALGKKLCEIAKFDCVFVKNDWDSIIPNLQSGNYDALMAGMSITPEREEKIAFSIGYTLPTASAYASLDENAPTDSGIIAAQTGTMQAAYVASSGAQLMEFATSDDSVAAVRNGQAAVVMADKDYLLSILADDLKLVGEDVMLGNGIGIGMRKSDTELKAKFDAAIETMRKDGSLNALMLEWFEADEVVLFQ